MAEAVATILHRIRYYLDLDLCHPCALKMTAKTLDVKVGYVTDIWIDHNVRGLDA